VSRLDPTERHHLGAPRIERGEIYRDVYRKRIDDRPALREANLERAWLDDDGLHFAGESGEQRALGHGVFLLRIPPSIDLAAGDRFAREFFRGGSCPPYGRFASIGPERFGDPLLGFHQRTDQIEQFLLERRFWSEHYPLEIAALGEALTEVARRVLCSVLCRVGIPDRGRELATGGCSAARGSYHLTFNHYRPGRPGVGLSSHKDDGFVTVLRTTHPGLEVARADEWERVPTDTDFFVVNFGLAMEILTAGCDAPVAAIMHRVTHQDRDRSSFGHFSSSRCVPGTDQGIYRFSGDTGLVRVCASRELIDNNDHEIYHGTREPERET
jgi:hypothetical protein